MGGLTQFEEFRRRFESVTVPADRSRYLGMLGAFRGEKVREKAFAYALSDKIRPNEIFTIPFSHVDTEEGR